VNERRPWLLVLALLLIAGGLYVLTREQDDSGHQPLTPSGAHPPAAPGPGLTAKGAPTKVFADETPPPTEDEWLASWNPKDGVPMGDDTLRGVVVDPAGKPIWDARVYLRTRPGQATAIDAPDTWNARTDRDGKWQIEMAYAKRSLLGAWAPGYERAYLDELDAEAELRIVLEPAPELTVTVKAPPTKSRFAEAVEDARLRVRLSTEKAHEHPRPGEALRAEWDQLVETDKPIPLRIPSGVPAHITADAPGLASDPAFVALPVTAKDIMFQLVPSAGIRLRLVDAKTKAVLPLGGGGWGFTRVTHMASGFELDSSWSSDAIWHERGITKGRYRIDLRYRGYVDPMPLRVVEVTSPDKRVDVDVLLERDMKHVSLNLILRHAKGSQHAGNPIEHARLTLVRHREAKLPAWTFIGGQDMPMNDGGRKRTVEDLVPGTYDVLVWGSSAFPPVGHIVGLKLEGGTERTIDVTLEEGFGFRPADALEGKVGDLRPLRAQSERLGALPWIAWSGDVGLYQMDAQGFADVSGSGYVGPYPSNEITIVERLKDGGTRKKAVKASISPPR
jgi:hypothetical protein